MQEPLFNPQSPNRVVGLAVIASLLVLALAMWKLVDLIKLLC